MILWTVQDKSVLDILEQNKPYSVSNKHIIFPESEDDACNHSNYAYKWLVKKMQDQIGPAPKDVTYPIWGWYKRQEREDGKPDMRSWKAEPDTEEVVRLKLDIPDWEVLLTDFDDWHCALNYWYLPRNYADANAFDQILKELNIHWLDINNWSIQSPELSQIRKLVEKSWDRMIGVNYNPDTYCSLPWHYKTIQATFWQIKPEYVLNSEVFKAQH